MANCTMFIWFSQLGSHGEETGTRERSESQLTGLLGSRNTSHHYFSRTVSAYKKPPRWIRDASPYQMLRRISAYREGRDRLAVLCYE